MKYSSERASRSSLHPWKRMARSAGHLVDFDVKCKNLFSILTGWNDPKDLPSIEFIHPVAEGRFGDANQMRPLYFHVFIMVGKN